MKRTYSTAGAARRRVRRQGSIGSSPSQSQSQGDDSGTDDLFGFSVEDVTEEASQSSSQQQSGTLSALSYHKMSSDTRRKTSLNSKSAGKIRAQMDDLQFNLDGLEAGSVEAQRLSFGNIATLCASASVRMHMRISKDDLVAKLLRVLVQSTGSDPDMRLASACIMHLLAADLANVRFFDADSVKLLHVLASAPVAAPATAPPTVAAAARPRMKPIRPPPGRGLKRQKSATSILPKITELFAELEESEITAPAFAMKTLLLLSDQHALKDDFRAVGVLNHVAAAISEQAAELDSAAGGGLDSIQPVLQAVVPHLELLEKVTFMNEANATYLVTSCASVMGALMRVFGVCQQFAAREATGGGAAAGLDLKTRASGRAATKRAAAAGIDEDTDDYDEDEDEDDQGDQRRPTTPQAVLAVCLRVLVNLTNEQPAGCALLISAGAAAAKASSSSSAAALGDTALPARRRGRGRASSSKSGGGASGSSNGGVELIVSFLILALRAAGGSSTPPSIKAAGRSSSNISRVSASSSCSASVGSEADGQGASWHDSLVVGLGLLVNLVEQNDDACIRLEQMELPALAFAAVAAATANGLETEDGVDEEDEEDGVDEEDEEDEEKAKERTEGEGSTAVHFFCDLYTNCSRRAGAAEVSVSAQRGGGGGGGGELQASQLQDEVEGLDEDDQAAQAAASQRVIASYAAVLLGFIVLRRPEQCGPRVRGRLRTVSRLQLLVEAVRSFGVAHAEAGVLLETQARAFDAMIASLLQLPPAAHGGEDGDGNGGEVDGFQAKEEEGGEGGRQ